MDVVQVYDKDVADITDLNRLSDFPRSYLELVIEALTNGKREMLFGTHVPTVFAIAAPQITLTIPAQYHAAEGRIRFSAQQNVVFTHPAPGTNYNVNIYLGVYLTDQFENRNNVNALTFVQTATSRVTHRLLSSEVVLTSAVAPASPSAPPNGVGYPGLNNERLGTVLLASFTWDGIAGSVAIIHNTADVVNFGSSGLLPHGGTHATTDPVPYPTTTERGMMPAASLPYLKQSISRLDKPAGSPMTITVDGSNGPTGDTRYTSPYSSATARGYLLDIAVGGSISKAGSQLNVAFGTPPGGGPGVANLGARSDHVHFIFPTDIPKYYNATSVSLLGPTTCPFSVVPYYPLAIVIDATRPNQLAVLQVEMISDHAGTDDGVSIMEISSVPVTKYRYAMVRAGGDGCRAMNTTTIIMPLSPAGQITLRGIKNTSPLVKWRVSLIGFIGQGA